MKMTNTAANAATAVAKTSKKVVEKEFNEYKLGFGSYLDYSEKTASGEWDGSPLQEDQVYHLSKMGKLPILQIEANRRTIARAMKMQEACHEFGMTTPAIFVDAKLMVDWGMKLIEPFSGAEATPKQIDESYVILEGNGRFEGYLLENMKKAKDNDYKVFDYIFTYKKYDSAEDAGAAYISTNESMTRTTNKDRLGIAGARCKNPLVQSFNKKLKEDGCIAKAGYFWNYGRELTAAEITSITKELPDAPVFDENLTQALDAVYTAFKEKFSCSGAEKVFRGVPAAKWAAGKLKDSKDVLAEADLISEKVKNMSNEDYTAILTAKSCNKTHTTREMVIQNTLDKVVA